MLCRRREPHPGHPERIGLHSFECPGRPEPGTPAGRAWELIYECVIDALHGDASGLDDGVADAVGALVSAGLIEE